MLIANAIYDVIFKYLMEDDLIAKDILSVILNVEIISLQLQPQEVLSHTKGGITIFRIDFKAVIKTKQGRLETVLIELQKSKKGYTSERFRLYVGEAYLKEDGFLNENQPFQKRGAFPITTIYFLNFFLKTVKIPILKVERVYKDGILGTNLDPIIREDFVELLSHNLYVIQIPRLKKVPMSEKEQILDVFNKKKYKTKDPHVLDFKGDMHNPKVVRIVDRLATAIADEQVRRAMQAEDQVEREIAKEQAGRLKAEQKAEIFRLAKEEAEKNSKIDRLAKEEAEKNSKIDRAAKLQAEQAKLQAEQAQLQAEQAKLQAEQAQLQAEQAQLQAEQKAENADNEIEELKKQLALLRKK